MPASVRRSRPEDVRIPVGADRSILGDLHLPDGTRGLVLFAHGSGSGRKSPRNQEVAAALASAGIGTLLVDLLTPEEAVIDEEDARFRFDIPLLAGRLTSATQWAAHHPATAGLRLGYFGASTGGAAALQAAAEHPPQLGALVLRGARTDMARDHVPRVQVPTLLLVGGRDPEILALNEATCRILPGERRLVVVPGASHLFEEPGALEEVARHTVLWFRRFLR